jgi:Fe-S oxidoreductase
VEMCSGVGACRKKLDGTMCPSYRATLEEKHSTRGRANTLRLAMTGQLGEAGLGDRGVYDVLDLCLECRACKTECPTGVDVARFKSEFLADYWRRHGVPPRARVFGHVHTAAKWGSRLAPVSNAAARSAAGRWLGEMLLGIDRRRTMPTWTRGTLTKQLRHLSSVPSTPSVPSTASEGFTHSVVLFADTFTNYGEPEIGVAAAEVLEAAGIRVRLVPHGCCGRPLISQGLLGEARALAIANCERLYDPAARREAILFLEPSCLSAVREDAPALVPRAQQEKARAVGRAAMLFEEYLERECAAGRAALPLGAGPASVLLHSHCHQRAMGLAPAARALLSRIPNATVTDLDAGCCGMAGSFGYTREHYAISRAIGELKLLPAARALPPGALLVAAGTSCRHQVAHFTTVRALHPAVLLRSLLARDAPA